MQIRAARAVMAWNGGAVGAMRGGRRWLGVAVVLI
jgi:hypothetical protein